MDPDFIFRKELEPANLAAGQKYRISDIELANRLSFFLWSSVPDDELMNLAVRNQAPRSQGSGTPGPAHAGRSALPAVRRELRRPVAEPARPRRAGPRHASVPRFRRQPAQRLPEGSAAVLLEHRPRRPQPDRPAERQLHVRQRAPGEALRNPQRLRQRFPPRDAHSRSRHAPRPARQGLLPRSLVAAQPHFAGAAAARP